MSKPFCSKINPNSLSNNDKCQVTPIKSDLCPIYVPMCEADFGAKGLYDFNDYLLLFAGKEVVPSYKVLIVDEAQDLSLIQWDCIERLIENAGDIHIAGDDDQAIFVWAGASVEKFRSFKNREGFKTEYLKQSRRVPQKIYVVAEKIIETPKEEINKVWEPISFPEEHYFISTIFLHNLVLICLANLRINQKLLFYIL